MRQYYVYMLANEWNKIVYTGVTNNLRQRVYEHKEGRVGGLVEKSDFVKLVYYEVFDAIVSAVNREREIKAAKEKAKGELVSDVNENWRDLYGEVCHWHLVRGGDRWQ